jgi:hypothetical protein
MGKNWLAWAGVKMPVSVVIEPVEAKTIAESASWELKY